MNAPDWKDAPEWAQAGNGGWWFIELDPESMAICSEWSSATGFYEAYLPRPTQENEG